MSKIKLRPHHLLCISFFEGKGYSDDFTRNMSSVIEMLERENPEILLECGADIICGSCPNNRGGVCEAAEKVSLYDSAVLNLCGLKEEDVMNWKDLHTLAERNIINTGKLKDVCGSCQWFGICGRYFGK